MIQMGRIKAVGFDLDGTFLKTHVDYDYLHESDKRVLERNGIPYEEIDFGEGRHYRTPIRLWMEANGRGEDFTRVNKEIDDECTRCEKMYVDEAVPFPGSLECLDAIRSKGLKIGLLTRGSREYGMTALTVAGVLDRFDVVMGRDHTFYDDAKPSPKAMRDFAGLLGVRPEEILYLGDNLSDWMSARDAGASFVGVTSGSTSREVWLSNDPGMTLLDYAGDVVRLL